jgi:hypothetical protein
MIDFFIGFTLALNVGFVKLDVLGVLSTWKILQLFGSSCQRLMLRTYSATSNRRVLAVTQEHVCTSPSKPYSSTATETRPSTAIPQICSRDKDLFAVSDWPQVV